jgi:hypothetical protein
MGMPIWTPDTLKNPVSSGLQAAGLLVAALFSPPSCREESTYPKADMVLLKEGAYHGSGDNWIEAATKHIRDRKRDMMLGLIHR